MSARGPLLPIVLVLSWAALARAQPAYDDGPPLRALLLAALDHPGLSSREVDDARRRARRSGALPRVQVRARRIAEDTRQAEEMNTGLRHRGTAEQTLLLEAQVQFDLGKLVYGADAVAWGREAREREERRHRRVREIVTIYYERQRLLLEIMSYVERDPALELRVVETEALLDALTHGAFSRLRDEALRLPPAGPREVERSGKSRMIR
jgi:hypothetical protein